MIVGTDRSNQESDSVQILVLAQNHVRRPEAEHFIAEIYRRHYKASVPTFPPTLIALLSRDGDWLCAAGLRFADDGFFSECYLDRPIDVLLPHAFGESVHRDRIFEVSSLASRAPRRAAQFLRYIVSYGEAAGFDWAFFTATERLRALLAALGLPFLILGNADKQRVPSPQAWGSYYDCAPLVCAVRRSAVRMHVEKQARSVAHA